MQCGVSGKRQTWGPQTTVAGVLLWGGGCWGEACCGGAYHGRALLGQDLLGQGERAVISQLKQDIQGAFLSTALPWWWWWKVTRKAMQ